MSGKANGIRDKSLDVVIICLVTLLTLSSFSSVFIKTVASVDGFSVDIEPNPVGEGKYFDVNVYYNDELVDATVLFYSGYSTPEVRTGSSVKFMAPLVDEDTDYVVKVVYTDYDKVITKYVTVKDFLTLTISSVSDSSILEGEQFTVTVLDQDDKELEGATVNIESAVGNTTDYYGIALLTAPELNAENEDKKTFSITASKWSYKYVGEGTSIEVRNRYLQIDFPLEIPEGTEFDVAVQDQDGNSIIAKVSFSGSFFPKEGNLVTFRAPDVGPNGATFHITATRENYDGVEGDIKVMNVYDPEPAYISGIVYGDEGDGGYVPIEGATVKTLGASTTTGPSGNYSLEVYPGKQGRIYVVTASMNGYKSETRTIYNLIHEGDVVTGINFRLEHKRNGDDDGGVVSLPDHLIRLEPKPINSNDDIKTLNILTTIQKQNNMIRVKLIQIMELINQGN